MTFAETLAYLYDRLPMYQRIGASAYKEDLTNTLELLKAIGNPERHFTSVHVAGTNGKGSSSHMLAAILQSAGYKTGLYTSPHLKDFTERIRINGAPVEQRFIIDFVERIRPDLERVSPSFFETTVAMAFDYFAEQGVEVAVIETGLGGRLDSTNVITPVVSLITNIGFDHQSILGNTLEKIAGEKAGIIKNHVPAVVSERQRVTEGVFEAKARLEAAELVFASDRFEAREKEGIGVFDVWRDGKLFLPDVACELKGSYQRKNIPGVLAVVETLQRVLQGGSRIDTAAIRRGIAQVVTMTGLKGRWQKLSDSPLTICDIGHNEDGINEVRRNLSRIRYRKLFVVFGMVNDKDISKVLTLLPQEATYFYTQAKIPRAMPAVELALRAAAAGKAGEVVNDVNEAIVKAKSMASPDDLIFIGGSAFVVAEIDNL